MFKALVATTAVFVCLIGPQMPANASSWRDYGYLKGCGMQVSQAKHGTPAYWRNYMNSQYCHKRLANFKANQN